MLIHRADLNKTIAIDYRETAPALTTKDVFLDANGEADPFKSRYSGLAIGVPGTVAGPRTRLAQIRLGQVLLRRSGRAGVALARQGLTVDDDVADSLPFAAPALRQPSLVGAHLSAGPTAARRRPATTSRSTISPRRSTRSPPRARPASTPGRSPRRSSPRCRRRAGG